jgi:hypothetical protein
VIAVRDLDAAARDFAALGFTLTPRGHHSIGSRNHCIMLGSTYLELLSPGTGPSEWLEHYRKCLEEGEGLAALAYKMDAPEGEFMDLSRPVEGGIARFRLTQLEPRFFLVQHLTPELVWRREWQAHANGATELLSVEWNRPAVLHLKGFSREAVTHGVRLVPA